MHRFKTFLTVIGAVTILVLAANTVAFAATGGKFVLGHKNTANKVSTLKRTTSGPALKLKTSSSSAPLAVNGTGKVANLNADRLDGLDSTQLSTRTTIYQDANFATNRGGSYSWHFPVSAGDYTITYSVGLEPSSTNVVSLCGFENLGGAADTAAWQSGWRDTNYVGVWLSATATVHFAAARTVDLFCNTGAASFTLESEQPLQITVTKITGTARTPALQGARVVPKAGRVSP